MVATTMLWRSESASEMPLPLVAAPRLRWVAALGRESAWPRHQEA